MARRLLVAVDFSDAGQAALDAAIALARDLRAGLVLVHAFSRQFMKAELPTEHVAIAVQQPDLEGRLEEREGLELQRTWAARARAAGLEVETETPRGDPARAIVEAARRHGAELIVVGTHGRTGLDRLLAGSVAEQVVRHADRPVLVVPHRA